MAKGSFKNLSYRAGIANTEQGVIDKFSTIARPKLKFNFTVTFKFRNPTFIGGVGGKGDDGTMFDEVTFALKQASRPNPTIMYQDVNFYNYRTKVATKVDYGTMQLTFYDDVQNNAHNLFEVYLKMISPIANANAGRASMLANESMPSRNKDFNIDPGTVLEGGTGSLGPLPNQNGGQYGLLENITIRHWFFSQTEKRIEGPPEVDAFQVGKTSIENSTGNTLDPENISYVEYQFLNPKIINMTFDELDMATSDASTIMSTFNYDSVYINSPMSTRPEAETQPVFPDDNKFTLNDVRAKIVDIQRLIRRVKRLDTLPDISVLETAGLIVPPITGNLPNIQLPKPVVDNLPPILNF